MDRISELRVIKKLLKFIASISTGCYIVLAWEPIFA